MSFEVKIFGDQESFWSAAADFVQNLAQSHSDKFRVAVSGGSSADIFDAIKDRNIDFSKWELWQVDERFVPHDDSDSNFRLLSEKIGDRVGVFHSFPILATSEESAEKYEEMLQPDSEGFLFDLAILGVGSDGHTASLFPGDVVLHETKRLTAVTHTDEFAVRERLTLTFPAIKKSRTILILLPSDKKKEVLERMLDSKTDVGMCPAVILGTFKNTHLFSVS